VYVTGLTHAANGAVSRLQENVLFCLLEVNEKLAVVPVVTAGGYAVIVV
jgi:hypothetical protein